MILKFQLLAENLHKIALVPHTAAKTKNYKNTTNNNAHLLLNRGFIIIVPLQIDYEFAAIKKYRFEIEYLFVFCSLFYPSLSSRASDLDSREICMRNGNSVTS